ncbi:MAG: ABC transporter ATP-binding protein [Dehalococcoidia bacterium]|nr:ABC transporter ATP-binding protein [Dehalococcoidia bacterium]
MEGSSTGLMIDNVSLAFGGVQALSDISFSLDKPELLAVIGPNGAGKTCILNCISGFYHPQKGNIYWQGKDITKLPPYDIAKLRLARTFQHITLYTGLNTVDNLMSARHIFMKQNIVTSALYFGWAHKEEKAHRERVEEIIDFLEIGAIRKKTVAMLPYGQRKRVDLGRALALEPELLLLDEPMAGMNADEKEDIARFIIDILETRKIPIIMVEHDMGVVMDIANRMVVLDFGHKIAEGAPTEIKANPQVIKAYLGED